MSGDLEKDFEFIITTVKEMSWRTFLHAGTLLNVIRDKKIIAYGKDFDFGFFRKEFPDTMRRKFITHLITKKFQFKSYEIKQFELREDKRQRPYVIKFWTPLTHYNVDFWIFEKREKDYYHPGWGGYFYFLKETLDTLDEIEFMGFKVLVPHNPELYLEHLYGKNWKIPNPTFKKPQNYPNWKKNLE